MPAVAAAAKSSCGRHCRASSAAAPTATRAPAIATGPLGVSGRTPTAVTPANTARAIQLARPGR
jgi:hypothetical protein